MRRHHLDTASNRPPLTRLARGYALAGAAAALVLLALARLDLGDPEPAVRAGLERDAEARARLVLAGLGERLGAPALLAPCVGQEWRATREVEGAQTPIQPTTSAPETETRPRSDVVHALLLITRERVEEGRPNDAREAIEQLLANPAVRPIDVAEARLEALRIAKQQNDSASIRAHLAAFAELPWGLALDGESARLLAALVAAPSLEIDERARLTEDVRRAYQRRELAPDVSSDVFVIDVEGARSHLTPRSRALRDMLVTRLPLASGSWSALFAEDTRGLAALEHALVEGVGRELATLPSERWVLLAPSDFALVPEDHVLALRREAKEVRAALHSEDALATSFATLALGTTADRPSAAEVDTRGALWTALVARSDDAPELATSAGAGARAEVVGVVHPLPGTPFALRFVHADPGALVSAERWRLLGFRGALVALAAAIGIATWLGLRSARRAAHLNHLRNTFVASVSHDLRTPLASISNLAENLQDGIVGGPRALGEYHAAIRREAARLTRLVSGLLDFARIERGELPRIVRAPVDAAEWLEALEGAVRDHCAPHFVAVQVESSALPATLALDADAVHRAVLNLVENAVRHSGTTEVLLRIAATDSRLSLDVIDRGCGVPASVREALFAPYACAGDTAGTGLGLAIVRSIATAHGGTARFASTRDGVGLCATIELALVANDAAGSPRRGQAADTAHNRTGTGGFA
jgi:signal transduction histidine kinase